MISGSEIFAAAITNDPESAWAQALLLLLPQQAEPALAWATVGCLQLATCGVTMRSVGSGCVATIKAGRTHMHSFALPLATTP